MQIDPNHVTVLAGVIAFVAGLASFLSPCVFPLVPAYIGYLSSTSVTPEGVLISRRGTLLNSIGFVLGFSIVFVALGASAALVGFLLQDSIGILVRSGAILLIVLGLRVTGVRLNLTRWLIIALVAALATYLLSFSDPLPRMAAAGMVAVAVLAVADIPPAARWGLGLAAGVFNSKTTDIPVRVTILASEYTICGPPKKKERCGSWWQVNPYRV